MKIKELKEDFINLDKTRAISAEGDIFKIGDKVCHEGSEVKEEVGVIISFSVNTDTNDVIAFTDKGSGRISFMYHRKV